MISIDSTIQATIGGAAITISVALIALMNNPIVRRTRAFLFIHLSLAIILILSLGVTNVSIPDTSMPDSNITKSG
jgi:hypothetical protein